ncbi:related to phenazine biosynthesis protein phzC [Phialocephala subalpina]|uniref:Related to phenazine biosynthesis protein phzC n=1 Tax=Phialocephala subalpina TaxID=576137 RepID=A0A1L7XHK9_9HELO|nr:related to phenazine biosynthesis protein phzC [Phialocephala subalpina]
MSSESSTSHHLPFTTLDVFTSTPYTGNPLALVRIPSSLKDTITQTQKQSIAKEFNLSETVFFHESKNLDSEVPEWKVDIFTTDEELPFAGHPTIGSATYALRILGKVREKGVLITKAGPIPISLQEGGRVQADIPHNTHLHGSTLGQKTAGKSIAGLSQNSEIRERELSAPLFSIVKGMTFLLVQLPNVELLGKVEMTGLSPDSSSALDPEFAPSFVSRYYYVLENEGAGEEVVKIRTRMVEAKLEDPATGSAASALSAYLAGKWGRSKRFEIVQGVEMGRRSEIGVSVEVTDGKVKGVRLSGGAVVVMEGSVRI